MKFLCFGYYDEKKFDALPVAERDAMIKKCKTHDEALRSGGHMMLVGSLGRPPATVSIRPRGGKPTFTDGPYAEAKEIIGAFFIIDAADMKEAVAEASKHPAAHLGEHVGWGIEVRPIDYFDEPCGLSAK